MFVVARCFGSDGGEVRVSRQPRARYGKEKCYLEGAHNVGNNTIRHGNCALEIARDYHFKGKGPDIGNIKDERYCLASIPSLLEKPLPKFITTVILIFVDYEDHDLSLRSSGPSLLKNQNNTKQV